MVVSPPEDEIPVDFASLLQCDDPLFEARVILVFRCDVRIQIGDGYFVGDLSGDGDGRGGGGSDGGERKVVERSVVSSTSYTD